MRVNFDLQRVEFAQDDSDDEIKMPYRDLINMYNKQYSMLMAETKKFYSQCKSAISSTLSLNQMGMGFNVPYLLHKFLVMENSINAPYKSKQRQQQWKQIRGKYQTQFHQILSRMGRVIDELLQFEIDIKIAYLGHEVKAERDRRKIKKQLSSDQTINKAKFLDDTSSITYRKSNQYAKVDKNQQESVLRGILKKNMSPQKRKKQKVCHQDNRPMRNLDHLLKKTDELSHNIRHQRVKQERIWEIFDEKRPSRLVGQADTQRWEIPDFDTLFKPPDKAEPSDSQNNNFCETFYTSFI